MFIVVESGSTKADWMVIGNENDSIHYTKGFNPYFHSEQDILRELNEHKNLVHLKDEVKEIFFYGAGCSNPDLNKIVEEGLKLFFKNAIVHVDHDLHACAVACYNDKPEIACILGTGSNSCYFDGKNLHEVIPALGHILGDEGSGSYFGKQILADFLYERLPQPMHMALLEMGINKTVIIENVYRKPDANVFIASFAPILIKHKELDYSQKLIRDGLTHFIDIHVKCYEDYKICEINFVGSLAELLKDELQAICTEHGLTIGRIIRRPLNRLVKHHKNIMDEARNSLVRP